jgi:hypothetical protein
MLPFYNIASVATCNKALRAFYYSTFEEEMQKLTLSLLLVLFSFSNVAQGSDDPFRPLQQLSNEIYRLAQDMVHHGSEGHTHEIVQYGRKMIERSEKMIEQIESTDSPKIQSEKEKMIASLKMTIEKAKEAVRLGEQDEADSALTAARRASFQAKQIRQKVHALR